MASEKQNAFTLVELLLAATLTTVILGSAFATFAVVMKAYKDLGGKTNQAEIARLIMDRMRNDLEAVFYSPHGDTTRFVGYDQTEGDLAVDSLTFISAVNKPVDAGEGSSDLAEIQYYIDLDADTPERWLLRRMDYTPDLDPFSGGDIALLGPHVESLDFQYFDGQVWWPEWDSTSEIPLAVNVTIGFFEASQMNEIASPDNLSTFSTTIWASSYRQSQEAKQASLEEGGGQSSGGGSSSNRGGGSARGR